MSRRDNPDPNQEGRIGCRIGLASLALMVSGIIWRFLGRKEEPELRRNEATAPGGLEEDPEAEKGVMGRPSDYPEESAQAGYELSDLNIKGIYKFGIGLLIAMGLVLGGVTFFQYLLAGSLGDLMPPTGRLDDPPLEPVPEVMQSRAATGEEYEQLRAENDRILGSYGWVDQEAGTVRIPIDVAIDLVAEQGLPTRPGAESEQWQDSGLVIPSYPSSGRRMEEAREWIYAKTAK